MQRAGFGLESCASSASPVVIDMTLAAVGQLRSTASLQRNGEAAARLIIEAAKKGAKAIFLPEASDYIAGSPAETVALAKPVDESPFVAEVLKALKSVRENHPIYVSVGIHEPANNQRVKNTLLWFDPEGKILNRYQKVHLFDVEITNGPILRESKSVEPGDKLGEPFQSPLGVVGPAICYDIRFPEVALKLRSLGSEIILFPSAFTVKTGQAHWHALAKVRAVDTQCYIINAAQVGAHNEEGTRKSYGHSIVVDPWGDLVAEATTAQEQVIYADIDLTMVKSVRENMPFWEQRRYDVYNN